MGLPLVTQQVSNLLVVHFIGRLSLETKPRPKSWPILLILWRRLNKQAPTFNFYLSAFKIDVDNCCPCRTCSQPKCHYSGADWLRTHHTLRCLSTHRHANAMLCLSPHEYSRVRVRVSTSENSRVRMLLARKLWGCVQTTAIAWSLFVVTTT